MNIDLRRTFPILTNRGFRQANPKIEEIVLQEYRTLAKTSGEEEIRENIKNWLNDLRTGSSDARRRYQESLCSIYV